MQHLSQIGSQNSCPVCQQDCKFIYSIRGQLSSQNTTELLSCGHILCTSCYHQWKDKSHRFSCPVCRQLGISYMVSFGSPETKTWNTLTEFLYSFRDSLYLLKNNQSTFIKLFRQVIQIEANKRKTLKEKLIKEKKQKKRAQIKKHNGELIPCPKCHYECQRAQLKAHINSKRCLKLQKKK